jgi:RimJ/RimL family protein N-acetyltransferase
VTVARRSPFEGDLVRLRAHESEDIPIAHSWFNDAEVRRYLGRQYPFSIAAVRERAMGQPEYKHALFAVETLLDGRLIGDVGLFAAYPEARAATLGIQIGDKSCWDGGYGTDTMRTVCRFGFEMMNLHRIELDVYAENARARHVYEKIGFRLEGCRRDAIFKYGRYHDLLVMALLEGELR